MQIFPPQPPCILVMGVSGCGKSTIARLLSEQLSVPFLEADDFHPLANKQKMAAKIPLTDADRFPWLQKLGHAMKAETENGFVVACSALKESYRQVLQSAIDSTLQIVFLQGSFEQILQRISARENHFMPTDLLKSQFQDLEIPQNALNIDIQKSPIEIVKEALQCLKSNTMTNIGIFGLGVMGKSLAKNLAQNGFQVSVYNLPLKGEEQFVANFAAENPTSAFFPAKDLPQFVTSLARPRKILLMVKSGAPIDSVIDQLQAHLSEGDIVIDGGNSYFKDTIRREKELAAKGVFYVGMGVSGGEKGALLGPSMMPAGNREVAPLLIPMLKKIAAKAEDGEPCVDWIGADGSGHFVKMVHNGIEYADMQIWGETYSILKRIFPDNQSAMADYLENWQDTLHHSFLLEITLQILQFQENGKDLLPQILDVAGHKGTGLWTVKEALDLGVPTPTIAAAMNSRITSAHRSLRIRLAQQSNRQTQNFPAAEIAKILTDAVLAARLIALAEGFHLLFEASKTYNWNLSLATIANIWRGGCIIRSKMLPEIVSAFEAEKGISHLFESPSFAHLLASKIPALEELTVLLAHQNCPCPALTAALQYYHSLHEAYSSINLIQAQRDCFGAHGYQKLEGSEEVFHTEWE